MGFIVARWAISMLDSGAVPVIFRSSLHTMALARRLVPREAGRWPFLLWIVELGEHPRAGGKDHPRLLRRGEDVHVGREAGRFLERTDAHEADRRTAAGIVAPQRHVAL